MKSRPLCESEDNVSFGEFRLCKETRSLFRGEQKVAIQHKPYLLLEALLEEPGKVVSRDKLQEALWGETVVDARSGLHTAVKKLREALGDDAATPIFIETVPKLGYRFIGSLDRPKGDKPALSAPKNTVLIGRCAFLGLILLISGPNPSAEPTRTPIYYQALRIGTYFLEKGDPQVLPRAELAFLKALEEAPQDGPALLGLAESRYHLAWAGEDRAMADLAANHASQALAQGGDSIRAQCLLAEYELFFRGRYDSRVWDAMATAASERPDVLNRLANLYQIVGEDERSLILKNRVLILDPGRYAVRAEIAYFLFAAGRFQEAVTAAREALLLEPGYRPARQVLARALFALEADDEAKFETLPLFRDWHVGDSDIAHFVQADLETAEHLFHQQYLRHLQDLAKRIQVPKTRQAAALARLGKDQQAVDLLQQAYARGETRIYYAFSDPDLRALNRIPEYRHLKTKCLQPILVP